MPDWRRGYIRRHLWQRIQGKSAPGVHPPAPLAPFPAVFSAKGTSASTLGTVIRDFRLQGYIRHPLVILVGAYMCAIFSLSLQSEAQMYKYYR